MIEPDYELIDHELSASKPITISGIRWRRVKRCARFVGAKGKPYGGFAVTWEEWQGELLDIDRVTNDRLFKLNVPDWLEASRERKGAAYPVSLPIEAVPPELRPQPPEEEPEASPAAPSDERDADALWARVVERVRRRSRYPTHVEAVIANGKFVIRVSNPSDQGEIPASVLFEGEWSRTWHAGQRLDEQAVAVLGNLRDQLERRLLELGLGPDSDGSGAFPHPYARFRYLCFRLEEVADFVNGEWPRFLIYQALAVAVGFAELWTELRLIRDAVIGRVVRRARPEALPRNDFLMDPAAVFREMSDAIDAGATLREAARQIADKTGVEAASLERAYRRARRNDPSLTAPKRGRPRRTRTS